MMTARITRLRIFFDLRVSAVGLAVCLSLVSSVGWAQTVSRPHSRVLPGGTINEEARPRWRFPKVFPRDITNSAEPIPTEFPESAGTGVTVANYEVVSPIGYYASPASNVDHVPAMLGDFFGAGNERLTIRGNELLNAQVLDTLDPATLGTGAPQNFFIISPGSSVLGRQKAAENNSPNTRDRAFLNYNYLSNTSLQDGGVGVHRFTPGVEKTFLGGMMSAELRMPMGVTFDSDSFITGGSSRDQGEWGNMNLGLKAVLCSTDDVLLSGGITALFPTADNLRFFNANRRELIRVENESFHLLPYLAGVWSDGGWFVQGFLQIDADLNGNPVSIDDGTGLQEVGDFRNPGFLFFDIGTGYWLIKDRYHGTITGLAPTMELHYNTAMGRGDIVSSPVGIQFGENLSQIEYINFTVGGTFEIHSQHTLAVGYSTPLGGGVDEQYDGELRILLNLHFGGR